jgi:hypothetical protein
MPQHARIPVAEIAPTAWRAICELCGGEERVADVGKVWSDGFIVNLGCPELEGSNIPPKELDNWHVDGDFFCELALSVSIWREKDVGQW